MDYIDEFLDENFEGDIEYDHFIYAMSLPYVFNGKITNEPYLKPDLEKVVYYKEKMKDFNLKVGLVWTGNPRKNNVELSSIDARRSIKLSQLEEMLNIPGITFVSLQKDDADNQIKNYPQIVDYMDEVKSFYDTTGIIENLDLIISVDTSVIHLAGGLGKPVWCFSRYVGCWRWASYPGHHKSTTVWYPEMRIYNQTMLDDWSEIISQVTDDLKKWADGQKSA